MDHYIGLDQIWIDSTPIPQSIFRVNGMIPSDARGFSWILKDNWINLNGVYVDVAVHGGGGG